jgi:glycosyltransferase involved in cell wall biosynthesis
VVHAHGLRAGAFCVLALAGRRRRGGVRVVVTVHNAPPAGGWSALVYRALEGLVARGADLVLCVSPDLEEAMRAAGARRVARAVVGMQAAADSGLDRPPVLAAHPVVLAAGRLAAQKGFGTLLEAAVQWQDLEPRPSLVIAGDGPLAGELRAKAVALGLDAAFLGQASDIPALLAGVALFVMPSLWEGQPLVLQEALRAGVPIVATRVGGVPDLVGANAALLVEPRDAAGLAAAVRAVLTDPALSSRLSAAAAERAARLPTEADTVAAALAAYAAASP